MLLDAAALSPSSALDDPVSAAVSSELQARCCLTECRRLLAAPAARLAARDTPKPAPVGWLRMGYITEEVMQAVVGVA